MGCANGKPAQQHVANNAIERRVIEALGELQKRKSWTSSSDTGGSGLIKQQRRNFNRVILKFPAIRKAFKKIRRVFDAIDRDHSGTVEYGELQGAMELLGANCTGSDVLEIFQESDIYHENKLTFREFLVCLAIAYVLKIIPGLRVKEDTDEDTGEEADEGPGSFYGDGQLFADAFGTVVDAYMIFDTNASGTIDRKEVVEVIKSSEGSHKGARRVSTGTSAFLSEDRWHELDADRDGLITFAEFLYGFATWVGLDDEEESEDEGEGEGAGAGEIERQGGEGEGEGERKEEQEDGEQEGGEAERTEKEGAEAGAAAAEGEL